MTIAVDALFKKLIKKNKKQDCIKKQYHRLKNNLETY